jgi:hypothetical protein
MPKNAKRQLTNSMTSRHPKILLLLVLLAASISLQWQFVSAFSLLGEGRRNRGMAQQGYYCYSSSYYHSNTRRSMADLKFSGDSRASLEFEVRSVDHVMEWLQTPSASDFQLLGTTDATLVHESDGLWDCPQPRIEFMGLDLQPTFVHKLHRQPNTVIVVEVVDSRTDVLNPNNPANRAVGSLLGRAKFKGKSIIQAAAVSSTTDNIDIEACRLRVDLTLTLHVPLPPFVLIPPGFNSIGSTIVKRTGKSRTEQLLRDLKDAYFEWAEAEEQQQQQRQQQETPTTDDSANI